MNDSHRNDPDVKQTLTDAATQDASEAVPQNSRRRFLQAGVTSMAAAMVAGSGLTMLNSQSALAESPQTAEAALKALMDGNRRFVEGKTTAHQQDIAILRKHLASQQAPFASVLSCSDSRVPVEIVFDQSLGQLFGARVAGNMVTPEIIASLEYGVAVLATKVILVLGHSSCGAVKAAIANKAVPGQISALYPHLRPAVDQAGPDPKAVTEANAKVQAHLLSKSSTVVAEAIKEGKLKVVAGYYDIGTGSVTLLG